MILFFIIYLCVCDKLGLPLQWYDWIILSFLTFLTLLMEKIRLSLAIMRARASVLQEIYKESANANNCESKQKEPFDEVTDPSNFGSSGI